jgi:CheY-like chemotaxis protein
MVLILLDVMLPDLDGVSLCNRLHSHPVTLHLPVIMLTSMTDLTIIRDSLEYGAVDYLAKPFDDNALAEKLGKALGVKP